VPDRNTIGEAFERAVELVRAERKRQTLLWGEQNHDDYHWLSILAEEFGETATAIYETEFGGKHAGTVKEELIQVAAVAVQWLECIERKEKHGNDNIRE